MFFLLEWRRGTRVTEIEGGYLEAGRQLRDMLRVQLSSTVGGSLWHRGVAWPIAAPKPSGTAPESPGECLTKQKSSAYL